MLVASMPRFTNNARVARKTFSWACGLLVLAMCCLQLNSGKQISAQRQKSHGDAAQQGNIQSKAKVRSVDEHPAQRVYAVCEGIETGDDGQRPGKIVQRKQSPRQKEHRQ